MAAANAARNSVLEKRTPMISPISRPLPIEVPKSPCMMPPSQAYNACARQVQPQLLLAQDGDGLGCCRLAENGLGRIAGQHLDAEKDNDRDDEQRQQAERNALHATMTAILFMRAGPESCAG